MTHSNFKIVSSGTAFPSIRVPSTEIDEEFGLPLGTLERESGVKFRHRSDAAETPITLGMRSALKALDESNGLEITDVDYLIYAGASPSQLIPCNAVLLHKSLGANKQTVCFDIDQTCVSFIVALQFADNITRLRPNAIVMVVCSELASRGINKMDLKTYGLFGDAAVTFIFKGGGASKLIDSSAWTLSEFSEACEVVGGGMFLPGYEFDGTNREKYLFSMDGITLLRGVMKHLPKMVGDMLTKNNLTIADIKMVVPHQASSVAMQKVRECLGIPHEKFVTIIQDYGNCVAASIPLAFHVALQDGRLEKGDCALLLGSGAGMTLSATLLRI